MLICSLIALASFWTTSKSSLGIEDVKDGNQDQGQGAQLKLPVPEPPEPLPPPRPVPPAPAVPATPAALAEPPPPPPTDSTRAPSAGPPRRAIASRCTDASLRHCASPRCKQAYSAVIGGAGTSCPGEESWVEGLVKVDPSPDKVIMNVGCNKGHDSVSWLEHFDQHGFWSLAKWTQLLSAFKAVCKIDTHLQKAPKVNSKATPTAICVEAMPVNVELLKEMRKKAEYESTAYGQFQIIHGAASDSAAPGATVEFPNGNAGKESGRMVLDGAKVKGNTVQVPLTTVDALVRDLKLSKVDILIIDTEGADPAVLRGAAKTLGSVRYLLFEAHRDIEGSHWARETIFDVVSDLNGHGFDCYWAGHNGKLYSITFCYEKADRKSVV